MENVKKHSQHNKSAAVRIGARKIINNINKRVNTGLENRRRKSEFVTTLRVNVICDYVENKCQWQFENRVEKGVEMKKK